MDPQELLEILNAEKAYHATYYGKSVCLGYCSLLPPIRAAEIVECVRKFMGGRSQNLQSLSSYYSDPPTVFLLLWIMVKQVKSSSQTS